MMLDRLFLIGLGALVYWLFLETLRTIAYWGLIFKDSLQVTL